MQKINLIICLLLTGCYFFYPAAVSIGHTTWNVDIANNPEERARGLMNVDYLPHNIGMWFEFEESGNKIFWMKNTLIPLDMIFIDENYTVQTVYRNVQPCEYDPCPMYASNTSVQYVLEVNAGEANFVNPGDEAGYFLRPIYR